MEDQMKPCANCQKPTGNPQYCSRSCAAVVNNKIARKRKRKVHHCANCGIEMPPFKDFLRRKYCALCRIKLQSLSVKTIGYLRSTKNYSYNIGISDQARRIMLATDRPQICAVCGYKKHVQVSHIRAIADFPDDTTIGEINDFSNLIYLCPNCHWEYDHGLLQVALVI